MSSRRRSSRSNKGKHSKRNIDEVYDEVRENEDNIEDHRKRLHNDDDEDYNSVEKDNHLDLDLENEDSQEEDEEDVRCNPCGTNKDNYDESTDRGGVMIQCDSCKTWQHAKCMGFKGTKNIPKEYKCDICDPSMRAKSNANSDINSIEVLKEKHRLSSAKAFLAFFRKAIPLDYDFGEGLDHEKLANKWTLELEKVIYQHASKKYNEESRRILFLIKKPTVIKQVIDREISFEKLVKSSPEEIDLDLKKYAQKVRQESIRRSVLTAEENSGQRIRRTHKGEEIVEDVNADANEIDTNVITRNIDSTNNTSSENSPKQKDIIIHSSNINRSSVNYNLSEDEELLEQDFNRKEDLDSSKLGNMDKNDTPTDVLEDDDDLDFIINGKRSYQRNVKPEIENEEPPKAKHSSLPSLLSTNVWSGNITFPDYVSFAAKAEFYSSTGYQVPVNSETARLHNRYIKICREILSIPSYDIEGKLDQSRAVDYLEKIVATRDIFLLRLEPQGSSDDFHKLFQYLLDKKKVGVLSGKPHFVKDSYIISIDFGDPHLPSFLVPFKKNGIPAGLYTLFVVKRDYIPTAPSILKKPIQVSQTPSNNDKLSSILKQLNEGSSGTSQDKLPTEQTYSDHSQSILSNLTTDQRRILEEVFRQNPQVAEDPQAYLQILQSYLVNGNSGSNSMFNTNVG